MAKGWPLRHGGTVRAGLVRLFGSVGQEAGKQGVRGKDTPGWALGLILSESGWV